MDRDHCGTLFDKIGGAGAALVSVRRSCQHVPDYRLSFKLHKQCELIALCSDSGSKVTLGEGPGLKRCEGQLKPGSRQPIQAPALGSGAAQARLRAAHPCLMLKQPLLTLEARSGREENIS